MSNLGNYQRMVVLAKSVGGPGKLAVLGIAATIGLWEAGKLGFRKFKSDLDNEPEIAVVETPDGDLIVVGEGDTSKSEGQRGGEQDSIDNVSSEEIDEGLS